MSENKIIEIEQDYSKENLEINPTWTPLSNGEIFSNYIELEKDNEIIILKLESK